MFPGNWPGIYDDWSQCWEIHYMTKIREKEHILKFFLKSEKKGIIIQFVFQSVKSV